MSKAGEMLLFCLKLSYQALASYHIHVGVTDLATIVSSFPVSTHVWKYMTIKCQMIRASLAEALCLTASTC